MWELNATGGAFPGGKGPFVFVVSSFCLLFYGIHTHDYKKDKRSTQFPISTKDPIPFRK